MDSPIERSQSRPQLPDRFFFKSWAHRRRDGHERGDSSSHASPFSTPHVTPQDQHFKQEYPGFADVAHLESSRSSPSHTAEHSSQQVTSRSASLRVRSRGFLRRSSASQHREPNDSNSLGVPESGDRSLESQRRHRPIRSTENNHATNEAQGSTGFVRKASGKAHKSSGDSSDGRSRQFPRVSRPKLFTRASSSRVNNIGRSRSTMWANRTRTAEPDLFVAHTTTSNTKATLNSATGILTYLRDDEIEERRQNKVARKYGRATGVSTPSSTASWVSRRLHLRLPKRKKARGSESSSILALRMTLPPDNTPRSDAMYRGPLSKDYMKVEISDPFGPTYLPSEAQRVTTPPLPNGGPSKTRGFFFDYVPPVDDISDPPPLAEGAGPETSRARPMSQNFDDGDAWFRSRYNSHESDTWFRNKVEEDRIKARTAFLLWHTPDHLPSSPLCAMNEKHKSGGEGFCVFHGRRPVSPDDTKRTRQMDGAVESNGLRYRMVSGRLAGLDQRLQSMSL